MTVLIFILVAVVVTVLVLEMRRRSKMNGEKAAKRRTFAGSGLVLERAAPGKKSPRKWSPPLAGPIALGAIFIILGAWMAFAYFVSDPESPAVAAEPVVQPPVELASTLTGRVNVSTKSPEEKAGMAKAAFDAGQQAVANKTQGPLDSGTMIAAARQAVMPNSRLGDTGLLPASAKGRQASPPAAAKPTATSTSSAKSAATAADPVAKPSGNSARPLLQPEKPSAAASNVKPPAPTPSAGGGSVGQPTMATAASSGGSTVPRLASTSKAANNESVLGGMKEFTVHLGSFGEKSNAEKYRDKLVSAGEAAFISEITTEGKLWHRVMSGRFASRAEAEEHGRDLRRRNLTADTGRYLIKPLD